MKTVLRRRNFWIACGVAFVALVLYLSLTPNPIPEPQVGDFDAGHAMAYAWLMFWFAQVFPSTRERIVTAVAFCAMGIGIEYLQRMTGYRTFSYTDMRDDVTGVAIGWAVASTPLGHALAFLERRMAT